MTIASGARVVTFVSIHNSLHRLPAGISVGFINYLCLCFFVFVFVFFFLSFREYLIIETEILYQLFVDFQIPFSAGFVSSYSEVH